MNKNQLFSQTALQIPAFYLKTQLIRTYPNLSELIRTYPHLSELIRTYPNLSELIRTYPTYPHPPLPNWISCRY